MTTSIPVAESVYVPMRPRPSIPWNDVRSLLSTKFGIEESKLSEYDIIPKADLLNAYEMMQLCRQFENACNQAYMQGNRV